MTLIDLKKTATLKWAVAVLATLLIAVMLGCSGEPEVRIVEVEKIVEREVVVVVTATPASTPVPIPPTVAPTPTAELVIRHSLSAGSKHTCGLRQDGKAVCWGVDPAGESSLLENERFTSIDVGSGQICGIRENGTVACWGDNHKGEASPPGGKFVAVSAGFNKTCGLLANGEATCWGRDL